MKSFFWKKVTTDRVRNSVWNDISNKGAATNTTLDLEKLAELFTIQDKKKAKPKPVEKKKVRGQGQDKAPLESSLALRSSARGWWFLL